jgi:RNA polymerase sigma-70 factor (ECF subfamily)
MEAARTLTHLPERLRRRRFTAACEELRPLGVAYVLRRFGGSLDHADAEDVVAEVIIRFDRLDRSGRPPERLRPAFFQSVRNAALDLLRYRGVRPTAPLEAAEWQPADVPGPADHAESHEDATRLREALARMRPNYREAIVLRFGLGLTVPEIAERVGISLPAAKKLVLRSTAQIRRRMEAIEGREFCPEMRAIAERAVIDGELAGLTDEAEGAAIKAHLEHCGACRGFLAALRSDLHDLGASALLGGLASGKIGLAGRLLSGLHASGDALHSGATRARLLTYRAGGALRAEGADSPGLGLAGSGQKIAALCAAGAAGAGACVATGIVGPGLGLAGHQVSHHHTEPPPAHVREAPRPTHHAALTYVAPGAEAAAVEAPAQTPAAPTGPQPRGGSAAKEARHEPTPKKRKPRHAEAKPASASQTVESQFGIESESSSAPVSEAAPTESPAPVAAARTVEPTPAPSNSSSASQTSSGSKSASTAGQEEFGFGG